MAEKNVALSPTLAAGDASAQYAGWKKGDQPEPDGISRKRASFKAALAAGVVILSGSDAGVFAHGDNARELELMVDYGMTPTDALKSATAVAGRILRLDVGQREAGPARRSDRRGRRSDEGHCCFATRAVRDEGWRGLQAVMTVD